MPLINLIYEQRQTIRRENSKKRMIFGTMAVTAALGTLTWGGLALATQGLQLEKQSREQQLSKMEPVMKAIKASKAQYSVLSPRLTTLEDAGDATKRWARILDHVSRSTPEGVWLTAIRCSQGAEHEPVAIEMAGLGPTQEAISEFILRVQNTEDLQGITLRYTQGEFVNEVRAIKFELSGTVAGTGETKKEEAEGDKEKKA